MSLDQRGRDAALAVRRSAERTTDVPSGLLDVRRRHHRHQVTVRASAAVVLLAVVGAVLLVLRVGTPTPPPPVDDRKTCATAVCDGSGEFVVDLRVPLVWTIPTGWEQHLSGSTAAARPVGSDGRSPVVVLEDVRGGEYASQAQDPVDAATVAAWMAGAQGLGASPVETTTFAGRAALHLTVEPTTGFLLFGTKLAITPKDQLDETWFADQPDFDISTYLRKDKAYVATPGAITDVWLLDLDGTTTAVVAPRSTDAAVGAAQRKVLDSMTFGR